MKLESAMAAMQTRSEEKDDTLRSIPCKGQQCHFSSYENVASLAAIETPEHHALRSKAIRRPDYEALTYTRLIEN